MERGAGRRVRVAREEAEAVLGALPAPLYERARVIPVEVIPRPTPEMEEEGIEPDLLGIFMGHEMAETENDPLPPAILLFSENIWDYVECDAQAYREEVRRTYLHELGHYLGLGEDDLDDRDLG